MLGEVFRGLPRGARWYNWKLITKTCGRAEDQHQLHMTWKYFRKKYPSMIWAIIYNDVTYALFHMKCTVEWGSFDRIEWLSRSIYSACSLYYCYICICCLIHRSSFSFSPALAQEMMLGGRAVRVKSSVVNPFGNKQYDHIHNHSGKVQQLGSDSVYWSLDNWTDQ